jgi:arginine exporter protein ArgO
MVAILGAVCGLGLSVQIDWSFLGAVNWAEVAWFSGIAFLAALVGHVFSKHWLWATILTSVLFAAGYVFLVYYPHERPVPGVSTVSHSSRDVLPVQKIPEAAREHVTENADQWKHSLLQPSTICSAIRCLGFSAVRAASSDR